MPRSSHPTRWRIGIDVGGTFTDFVALPVGAGSWDLTGALTHKFPSTPADPSIGVGQGLAQLLARGIEPDQVEAVTHGTTIGLNAILQGRGARVALLTSVGHRDVLQIGRARLPRSFDLHARPPRVAVPRERVVELPARFSPDGQPVWTVSEQAYCAARDALAATAPEAVAVSLLGGYAAEQAETDLARRLARDLGVPVTAAAAVWPQAGEFERTTLAVLDAQIAPLMTAYFSALRERLSDLSLRAPLFISASNGGSVSLRSAIERPIQTVLSGPAAGVGTAARLWPGLDMLTIDMGGTSSDIGVLRGGRPVLTTSATIGDHPVMMPVVEVSAIGAGGGSLLWADRTGAEPVLRVGPASAGADPGPASYARGGQDPALTDAYVHAGIIDADNFLGGTLPLSTDLAVQALGRVADGLGFARTDATSIVDGALRTASAGMAARLRTVLARHGEVPERFTLVAFGGAGGTHAALLAEEVGVRHVLVPSMAGTFCALGAAITPVRRDLARTLGATVDATGTQRMADAFTDLAEEGLTWLADQHAGTTGRVLLSADLRYAGQPTTLLVALAETAVDGSITLPIPTTAEVVEAFRTAHAHHHGFTDPSAAVQVETVRVTIVGADPAVDQGGRPPALVRRATRQVRHGGRWLDAGVYELSRTTDAPTTLSGPAVVEKPDTSIFVPPGWWASTDAHGHLHVTRDTPEEGPSDAVIA